MPAIFKFGAIFAALYSLSALIYLIIKTGSFPGKKELARPQGKTAKGIAYALGPGLLPWAKESAGKHLPSYLGGIIYHAGIFSGFLVLSASIFSWNFPFQLKIFIQIILLSGLAAGIALLIKRVTMGKMRAISCPDDYSANIIVDVFVLAALLRTFSENFAVVFYLISMLLFIYIPVGKIRHCVFFFISRMIFGKFFGRRGVLAFPKVR